MGETRCMQPIITVKGIKPASAAIPGVVQPVSGWGDAQNVKDAVFHVQILALDGTDPNYPTLQLETAASAAGPWRTLKSWTVGGTGGVTLPVNEVVGASTRAPGFSDSANLLERFYRWKIDPSALSASGDTYAVCFGICVTLK